MPRLDRSGPSGAGPRTGGGRGLCGRGQVQAPGAGGRGICDEPPAQSVNGRRQCHRRQVRRFVPGADSTDEPAVDLARRAAELRKELAMINARLESGPTFGNRDRSVE